MQKLCFPSGFGSIACLPPQSYVPFQIVFQ